jgi:hypothetical protein
MSGQADLLVIELQIQGKRLWKIVKKFERHPIVASKVIAILTRYSSLANQISSSPSNDSIATPRKTASRN